MVGLIKELAAELKDAVKTYRLHGDRDPPDGVTFYQQYIPVERFDDKEGRYHPFVLIACRSIEDGEQSESEIGITVGVYGEDDETWTDLLNLMTALRLRLLSKRIIGRKYRLIDTLISEISEVQPAPFFYGEIIGRYEMYQPLEEMGTKNGRI